MSGENGKTGEGVHKAVMVEEGHEEEYVMVLVVWALVLIARPAMKVPAGEGGESGDHVQSHVVQAADPDFEPVIVYHVKEPMSYPKTVSYYHVNQNGGPGNAGLHVLQHVDLDW